jgi:hypothetical protein
LRDSLRRAGPASPVVAIAHLLIGGKTITIIILHPLESFIGVGDRGGCGRDLCSRRRRSFGVDGILLVNLFFLIGVTEDDDLAIIGWPEDIAVEVIKKLFGELLIS